MITVTKVVMGKTWAKPISSNIPVQIDRTAPIATKIPVLQIDPWTSIAPTKIPVLQIDPRTPIASTIPLTENINDQVNGGNPQPDDGSDGTGTVAGYHCSEDIDRVDYLKQCAGRQYCRVVLGWNRNVCPSVRLRETLGVTVHYECSTAWGKCFLIL